MIQKQLAPSQKPCSYFTQGQQILTFSLQWSHEENSESQALHIALLLEYSLCT